MRQPEIHLFAPSDWVPNHPFLPVLFYRDIFAPEEGDRADLFTQYFEAADWEGTWRNGVYSYQHYHSGAHEVLGIAEGRAELLIGGPTGARLAVASGDCLVLPAGTGHRLLSSSADFLVVGAYPPGEHADIRTEPATTVQIKAIATLPVPQSDPLYGTFGPLVDIWKAAADRRAVPSEAHIT